MSDLALNVTWQEILRETESGNIPHSRAIVAPSKWHNEIIEGLAKIILGSYRPTHPDLIITGTIEKAPAIGQADETGSCRWLIETIALKPMEAKKRLGVIMCADKLNQSAANSLLKLSEEPPEYAYLLFLMEDGRYFLPTLRSRSRLNILVSQEDQEALKIPQNASEWIEWLAASRKSDNDAIMKNLESWTNYAITQKNFVLAEKVNRLKIIAGRKNLSVPLLCDMIILTLREGNNYLEYIFNDLR